MSIDYLTQHPVQLTRFSSTTNAINEGPFVIKRRGITLKKNPSPGQRAIDFLRTLYSRSMGRTSYKLSMATSPKVLNAFVRARWLSVNEAREAYSGSIPKNDFLRTPSGRIIYRYDSHWEKTFNELCKGRSLEHWQLIGIAKEADAKTCDFFYTLTAHSAEIDMPYFLETSSDTYRFLAEMPSGQHMNPAAASPVNYSLR